MNFRVVAQRVSAENKALYKNYEQLIEKKLAIYIKDRDFIVKVSEKFDTTTNVEFSTDGRMRGLYDQLPGIPDASSFFAPTRRDTIKSDSINKIADDIAIPRIRKYLNIELIVSSKYKDEDVQFIKDLIKMVVPVNEEKGDRISVVTRRFPKINKSDNDSLADDSVINKTDTVFTPAPETAAQDKSGPVFNNTITNTNDAPAKDSSSTNFSNLISSTTTEKYLPYLILGFLLLVIVGLLIFLLVRQKKNNNQSEDRNYKNNYSYNENRPNSPLGDQAGKSKTEQVEDQKQVIISHFIKSPKAVSAIIELKL